SRESTTKYRTSLTLKLPSTVPLIPLDVQVPASGCRYLVRVIFSARKGASMRGIDRFLAAILLAGAVGGVAVFSRHLGSVPEPQAIHLAPPPVKTMTAQGA